MRLCSNPRCRAEIFGCMGTCKAGDILEWNEGKREQRDVRELCEKCAVQVIAISEVGDAMRLAFFNLVGWGTPLLPPPKSA